MVHLIRSSREQSDSERIFPSVNVGEPFQGSKSINIKPKRWELSLALIVSLNLVLGAQLTATYAAYGEFNIWPAIVGGSLALITAGIGLLHIQRLSMERSRVFFLNAIDETLRIPRDIEGTARATASRLVQIGLGEAVLVAVFREEEGARPVLFPLATAGYPDMWMETAERRVLAVSPSVQVAERVAIGSDSWLRPLESLLGKRPWVARVPIERDGTVLGQILLVMRHRGLLRDVGALAALGARVAAALESASLYELGLLELQMSESEKKSLAVQ
jgi:hypothetical protein